VENGPPEPEQDYQAPPYQVTVWLVLGLATALVLSLFSVRCGEGPDASREYAKRTLPAEPAPVLLAAPEMDDEYWPCSDCHDDEPTNFEVRELDEEHDEMNFAHGDTWCLSCHDADDRDMLHRAGGAKVGFDESWKLCTQCHGHKLEAWRVGVHGKRTGHWWGPKEYRTCVSCHDPHNPPFKPLKPLPPPRRPEAIDGGEVVETNDAGH